MALFKCKACGGDVVPNEDGFTGKCEYCGSIQTLPKDKGERISQILNRANDYRLNSEFDRAIFEYEKVLEINEKEPEAHWGLFLSKYGVEYVKDTMTLSYKPTLHRISSISVFDDIDYKATLKYASPASVLQYENKAKDIEQVMKELLSLSANQEPFDVFLSYKEVDDVTRQRTDDSYLAHDLYNELTAQGYKVFFAPKSLGAGLYEPKIYSAIISSKVMIVLGTKPQYFDAVWVKNEWSRFSELIENGEDKVLLPVFKNMEANQLPNRLAKYQAYNMATLTFIEDVKSIILKTVNQNSNISFNNNVTAELAYIERGFLALEDKDFSQANSFFENALNLNPHNSQAYFGKLMVEMKISKQEQILSSTRYLDSYKNFEKAVRFADQQLKSTLLKYEQTVKESIDTQKYNIQKEKLKTIASENDLALIIGNLKEIEYFRDVKAVVEQLSADYSRLLKINDQYLNEQKEIEKCKKEIEIVEGKIDEAKKKYCGFLGSIIAILIPFVLTICAMYLTLKPGDGIDKIKAISIPIAIIGLCIGLPLGLKLERMILKKINSTFNKEKLQTKIDELTLNLCKLNREYDEIIKKTKSIK